MFAYNPARVGELRPNVLGWHSIGQRGGLADPLAMPLRADASRLEAGNPSLLGLFVLDNALRGARRSIRPRSLAHARALGDALIAGLRRRGRAVITPEPPEERAGNVCFLAETPARLAARLTERGCWSGAARGAIRVSAHLYNGADDVAAFFRALDAL